MPATFNLELSPGQYVALDTTVSSDELDMVRIEDGTTMDGNFWGKLNIVHDGDTYTMDFSRTRLHGENITPDLIVPLVNPYPYSGVGSEMGMGTGKALDTQGYTRAIRYFSTA